MSIKERANSTFMKTQPHICETAIGTNPMEHIYLRHFILEYPINLLNNTPSTLNILLMHLCWSSVAQNEFPNVIS